MRRRSRKSHASSYLVAGRHPEDWLGDVINVQSFRPPDYGDSTPAFQAAIDAAYRGGSTSAKGKRVVVPSRQFGYKISGLRMRSGVDLIALGTVQLQNNVPGTDTIIFDGADDPSGVIRWTEIANFDIRGNGRPRNAVKTWNRHGIYMSEHADCRITRCRVKTNGGNGILAKKGPGGTKSDGLTLDHVWIDDNRRTGFELGFGSHYTTLMGSCRISYNDLFNTIFRGTAISMTGGVIATGETRFESVQGGCFSGVSWEATPLQKGPLIHLADSIRGLTFTGCYPHGSGALENTTIIKVGQNCFSAIMIGGMMDAQAPADFIGVDNSSGGSFILDTVHDGGNVGSGSWIYNMGATVR